MTITKIIAENFRCFRKVEARLAPLTLLVGENSTGKTSFLALVRALLDSGYHRRTPDFREPPYDLGMFRDIARDRGLNDGAAKTIRGSFEASLRRGLYRTHEYRVVFREHAGFAFPSEHRYRSGEFVFTERSSDFQIETRSGRWSARRRRAALLGRDDEHRPPPWWVLGRLGVGAERAAARGVRFERKGEGAAYPTDEDVDAVVEMLRSFSRVRIQRPYCSAPVRTRPLRTYEPLRPTPDAEGAYIPTYMAGLSERNPTEWDSLRQKLESFGRVAGLFDEIRIHPFGDILGGPFQIQVRRHSERRREEPWRNLLDVGYGVSQTLPVLTEIHRSDGAPMFLLQQPEVHLHPSAQAALGSLLCEVAESGRQVIVETHSDHLMDRVRMDVRDGTTNLNPKDVSLLFFERGDLDVNIHSIEFDEAGSVNGAPDGYRRFFFDEVRRSISL